MARKHISLHPVYILSIYKTEEEKNENLDNFHCTQEVNDEVKQVVQYSAGTYANHSNVGIVGLYNYSVRTVLKYQRLKVREQSLSYKCTTLIAKASCIIGDISPVLVFSLTMP